MKNKGYSIIELSMALVVLSIFVTITFFNMKRDTGNDKTDSILSNIKTQVINYYHSKSYLLEKAQLEKESTLKDSYGNSIEYIYYIDTTRSGFDFCSSPTGLKVVTIDNHLLEGIAFILHSPGEDHVSSLIQNSDFEYSYNSNSDDYISIVTFQELAEFTDCSVKKGFKITTYYLPEASFNNSYSANFEIAGGTPFNNGTYKYCLEVTNTSLRNSLISYNSIYSSISISSDCISDASYSYLPSNDVGIFLNIPEPMYVNGSLLNNSGILTLYVQDNTTMNNSLNREISKSYHLNIKDEEVLKNISLTSTPENNTTVVELEFDFMSDIDNLWSNIADHFDVCDATGTRKYKQAKFIAYGIYNGNPATKSCEITINEDLNTLFVQSRRFRSPSIPYALWNKQQINLLGNNGLGATTAISFNFRIDGFKSVCGYEHLTRFNINLHPSEYSLHQSDFSNAIINEDHSINGIDVLIYGPSLNFEVDLKSDFKKGPQHINILHDGYERACGSRFLEINPIPVGDDFRYDQYPLNFNSDARAVGWTSYPNDCGGTAYYANEDGQFSNVPQPSTDSSCFDSGETDVRWIAYGTGKLNYFARYEVTTSLNNDCSARVIDGDYALAKMWIRKTKLTDVTSLDLSNTSKMYSKWLVNNTSQVAPLAYDCFPLPEGLKNSIISYTSISKNLYIDEHVNDDLKYQFLFRDTSVGLLTNELK